MKPVVARARNRRDTLLYGNCAVLLYHRVIALETDPQLLAVDPDHFDEHLGLLKKKYRVLTVDEFDRHLIGQMKFPKNSVLLTFDDGYADNHQIARPILEKHGLQALFYISSGYMGAEREYWWDELERLLLLNKQLPRELNYAKGRIRMSWRSEKKLDARVIGMEYERMLAIMRSVPSADRDIALDELAEQLNASPTRKTHLPMSVEELRGFAASPSVVIGAHTAYHPSLAAQSEEEQRQEIFNSKRELEQMIGKEVPYFSFPFGTPVDFNETTLKLVQEAGFAHVAANYPNIVHARSPRFEFPRFLVRNWTIAEFEKQVTAFFRG